MDKVTKKYLLNLIESTQSDVDEMASYTRKDTRKDTKAPGEFLPIFPPSTEKSGEYSSEEGYYLPQINQVVLILDCLEKEQFIEKNKDWLEGLAEKWHNKYGTATEDIVKEIAYAPCKKTKYPRKQQDFLGYLEKELGYKKPETKERTVTEETINKTEIGKLLRENLFGPNVSTTFRKKSIPFLPLEEGTMKTLFQGLRGYGDQHTPEFTDQKISFRLFAGSLYESQSDFLMTLISNYEGDYESTNEKNLRLTRQFNKKYSNYDAGRKMVKKFEGLTPVQKKQVRDYEEANIDATIRMDMNIMGELIGENSFTWNISLSVKLGKKLEEDERLKDGFKTLENIRTTKTVQLNPNDSKSPIMKNKEVREGFISACDEIREKVESIEFEKLLEYANVEVSTSFDIQESIDEVVDKIINKIIK